MYILINKFRREPRLDKIETGLKTSSCIKKAFCLSLSVEMIPPEQMSMERGYDKGLSEHWGQFVYLDLHPVDLKEKDKPFIRSKAVRNSCLEPIYEYEEESSHDKHVESSETKYTNDCLIRTVIICAVGAIVLNFCVA